MKLFLFMITFTLSVAVSNSTHTIFSSSLLLPRAPTREPKVWSTSKQHGYQGTRTTPNKDGSPDRSPPSLKEDVEVRARVRGPATLRVANGRSNHRTRTYDIRPGRKLSKSWSDPDKLIVTGKTNKKGSIVLDSVGSKVYTGVTGDERQTKVESGGPGPQRKRERRTEWGIYRKGSVEISPDSVGEGDVWEKAYVKNSARVGRVGAIGTVKGYPDDEVVHSIKAVASNSPSHSRPPSPGHPFPPLNEF